MNQTTHPPDRPPGPAPQSSEARTSCADCGGSTRRCWRRGHDGVLRPFLRCTECKGLVCSLPDRPREPDEREQLVKDAADNLDALCDRAVVVQRDLLARAFGPSGPLPMARARAIHAATIAALATLSDEHLDTLEARLNQQTQTARFRGWHRAGKRQKWQPVVSADTEDAALDALLNAAQGGDKLILPAERNPNEEGRPR